MTYTVHDPKVVYDAIETRLNAQLTHDVGRAEIPDGHPGEWPYAPYAVLYPTDDPNIRTLGDASVVAVYEFQVTCAAGTPAGAEFLQAAVRTALLGWKPTVSGRSFGLVEKVGGQGTSRDDDIQPPLFFTVDVFSMFAS